MPIPGDPFSFWREDAVLDLAQLDQILPVGRVFFGVGLRFINIDILVVQAGADFPGEQERPADSDGADGIQLVGIKQDSGFLRDGNSPFPESMGLNTMDDTGDGLLVDAVRLQDLAGHRGARLGMADFSVREVFCGAPDIV